jgi:hypothetical protein
LVLVDSNVFIVDRFYPGDAIYAQNRGFIEKLPSLDAAVSVLTLMELCGGASYRLSPIELDTWLYRFDSIYPVNVVNVQGIAGKESEAWWHDFLSEIGAKIAKKMTLGDALILREAENYDAEAIITWNTKDFIRRTAVSVLTPTAYLQRR